MYYAIDFDSRQVESKSEDGELLAEYVLDNKLESAVALISSADEICLEFSLNEMKDIYGNVTGGKCDTDDEEALADTVWEILNNHQSSFPNFTKALGKKLIENASKESKPTTKTSKPKTTKVSTPRVTLDHDGIISVVDAKCKKGSILHTIVTAIDDELCDTVGDVVEYILTNHVIPKTGELADIKFAEHNIKYFVKKGNLSLGDEL